MRLLHPQLHKTRVKTPAQPAGNASVVLGICVAMGFTTLLDQAIFALAVPRLRDGLHASASQLQLIISIYSVAFGVALVPAGRLGDIIGRRSLFLIGLAMFAGFSVLGGLAWSAETVIAARLLQGLGAAAALTARCAHRVDGIDHVGARAQRCEQNEPQQRTALVSRGRLGHCLPHDGEPGSPDAAIYNHWLAVATGK